jgi:hypothetical protein
VEIGIQRYENTLGLRCIFENLLVSSAREFSIANMQSIDAGVPEDLCS